MNIRFYIWVTSNCNLACPLCMQDYSMKSNKGYSMSREEIDTIVESCLRRNIRFHVIELTGGEASIWPHLEYGYEQFCRIADSVMLATNGNNPERIIALGMKTWIVSESQATPEQMEHYNPLRTKLIVNNHAHKRVPDTPIGPLPAACTISRAPDGSPQNAILYRRGKVYYCCNLPSVEDKVPITPEGVIGFEEDFLAHFSAKKYDQPQCRYCLSNSYVWDRVK